MAFGKKKTTVLQGDQHVYICVTLLSKFHDLEYILVSHSIYSQGFSFCDYFIVLNGSAKKDVTPTKRT